MPGLLAHVSAALKRFFPRASDLRLGVAVSGGPDSIALLGSLVDLAAQKSLRLTVLHVNHALRPEADQEQQLVEDLCRRWQLPCLVKTLTVPQSRSGIEAWAERNAISFFDRAKSNIVSMPSRWRIRVTTKLKPFCSVCYEELGVEG